LTASTHDQKGIIQHTSEEAMQNTIRLEKKIIKYVEQKHFYTLINANNETESLIVSYGVSANAAEEAQLLLKEKGIIVDLLIVKTLLPIATEINDIIRRYKKITFAEDNYNGQYARIVFGDKLPDHVKFVGAIGKMLSPKTIIEGGIF
jgi:2-oxoglutarate ferredoxin oxidoreductase subunit alpha